VLHWFGIRSSSRIQELTSLAKGIALLAFVAACFILPHPQIQSSPMHVTSGLPFVIAMVLALQSIIVTYDGWYTAIYFTEEVQDPVHSLPKSAIGGILCTIVIYLLINGALLHVLPMSQFAQSELPAAAAAQNIFGGNGGRIITVISLISLLSVINAVLLLAARILYSLSRDRLFVSLFSRVSPTGTPIPAMLLTVVASIVLVLSGTFERLIAIAAFLNVIVYSSGFISLFILRRRNSADETSAVHSFRAPGYPFTPLIALIGSIGFLIGAIFSDRANSIYTLILIFLSYPVYLLTSRKKG
jgi:APA family basic amino acid/polyamine antiporter